MSILKVRCHRKTSEGILPREQGLLLLTLYASVVSELFDKMHSLITSVIVFNSELFPQLARSELSEP